MFYLLIFTKKYSKRNETKDCQSIAVYQGCHGLTGWRAVFVMRRNLTSTETRPEATEHRAPGCATSGPSTLMVFVINDLVKDLRIRPNTF